MTTDPVSFGGGHPATRFLLRGLARYAEVCAYNGTLADVLAALDDPLEQAGIADEILETIAHLEDLIDGDDRIARGDNPLVDMIVDQVYKATREGRVAAFLVAFIAVAR